MSRPDSLVIEQNDTAILYTGDLRSEPWFVNYIARHPLLIEYTSGIKRLDKIYLDTSFTDDVHFQTKSEGIAELLRKVAKYPEDTVFYFQTWTYGYEEVWLALSKALKSKVGSRTWPCGAPADFGRFTSMIIKWEYTVRYLRNRVTPVSPLIRTIHHLRHH